jgi:hypothetical protein
VWLSLRRTYGDLEIWLKIPCWIMMDLRGFQLCILLNYASNDFDMQGERLNEQSYAFNL